MTDAKMRKLLRQQTNEALVDWWVSLNRWQWPDGIGPEESPDAYRTGGGVRFTRRWRLMERIEKIVGTKAISRKWNDDMSDDEFDKWWRKHGE